MPKNLMPLTHTGITAEDRGRIGRLERRPAATSRELHSVNLASVFGSWGGAQHFVPGLAAGESTTVTIPMNGRFTGASDIKVNIFPIGSFAYTASAVILELSDPLTGDTATASGFSVAVGGGLTMTWSSHSSTGTAFTWSGTGWRRATNGPVTGFAQCGISAA